MRLKQRNPTPAQFFLHRRQGSEVSSSTIFDLIGGQDEPKQTKALAFVMARFPRVVHELLKLPNVANSLPARFSESQSRDLKTSTIEVDAELTSTDGKLRRDITIAIDFRSGPQLSLVIEAKSVSVRASKAVRVQLAKYFDGTLFPIDAEMEKVGLLITKHQQLPGADGTRFASVTWHDVVELVSAEYRACLKAKSDSAFLLRDFCLFIQSIYGSMKFYEKEVVSFPATKTHHLVEAHRVYGFPLERETKTPLFATFREKGGKMKMLYKVVAVLELSRTDLTSLQRRKLPHSERILAYLKGHQNQFKKGGATCVYVLSKSDAETIKLDHGPKPPPGAQGKVYYSLAELLSGKEVVRAESSR